MADESQLEEDVRDLRDRMTRVETIVAGLVTREDLANFRATVVQLQEATKNFESLADSVATRADVDWIKKFVAWGLGLIGSVLALLAGITLNHVIHP